MPRGIVVVLSSFSSIFGASFIFHALMDVAAFSGRECSKINENLLKFTIAVCCTVNLQ